MMNTWKQTILGATSMVAVLLACLPLAKADSLAVANPDFELPVTIGYYGSTGSAVSLAAQGGTGWNFDGTTQAGIAQDNSYFNSPDTTPSGSNFAFIQYAGLFSQTISGFPTGIARVSFFAAAQSGVGSATLEVSIDGVTVTFGGNNVATVTDAAWTRFTSDPISLPTGSHILSFGRLNGIGNAQGGVFVDSVGCSAGDITAQAVLTADADHGGAIEKLRDHRLGWDYQDMGWWDYNSYGETRYGLANRVYLNWNECKRITAVDLFVNLGGYPGSGWFMPKSLKIMAKDSLGTYSYPVYENADNVTFTPCTQWFGMFEEGIVSGWLHIGGLDIDTYGLSVLYGNPKWDGAYLGEIRVDGETTTHAPVAPAYDPFTTTLHPGVALAQVTVTTPRKMKINCLRIDTTAPGIRFESTGRCSPWVADSKETKRKTTRKFIYESQSTAKKVVAAVNATPWNPTGIWNQEATCNANGLLVSGGLLVSPGSSTASFLVHNNNTISINSTPVGYDITNVFQAVSGFYQVLAWGVTNPNANNTTLEPRTGIGHSQDHRYVYFMTIDGRQTASAGATEYEVGSWLLKFGAYDGIQMDGGGSTTLAWWNPSKTTADKSVLLNVPVGNGSTAGTERCNATNIGVYYVAP